MVFPGIGLGGCKKWEKTSTWENLNPEKAGGPTMRLNHSYDESKPSSGWNTNNMAGAAHFRGGECISTAMKTGDLATKLK
ncbi:hypothetical protein [Mucilaginibacter dorajii]|uniref:Uncharacterized protein n=1 Tax=Mucilaginibacter dorajii TaxID=692994 RepID=A0ABP7QYM1_9SPHI|nr:hypothetical protein [Mucilaginibacter dorajii]MCS3732308.1 hypothetical protein [Mucilaginibacter dorajii]